MPEIWWGGKRGRREGRKRGERREGGRDEEDDHDVRRGAGWTKRDDEEPEDEESERTRVSKMKIRLDAFCPLWTDLLEVVRSDKDSTLAVRKMSLLGSIESTLEKRLIRVRLL